MQKFRLGIPLKICYVPVAEHHFSKNVWRNASVYRSK